jgi:hypothetical protein
MRGSSTAGADAGPQGAPTFRRSPCRQQRGVPTAGSGGAASAVRRLAISDAATAQNRDQHTRQGSRASGEFACRCDASRAPGAVLREVHSRHAAGQHDVTLAVGQTGRLEGRAAQDFGDAGVGTARQAHRARAFRAFSAVFGHVKCPQVPLEVARLWGVCGEYLFDSGGLGIDDGCRRVFPARHERLKALVEGERWTMEGVIRRDPQRRRRTVRRGAPSKMRGRSPSMQSPGHGDFGRLAVTSRSTVAPYAPYKPSASGR